MELRYLRYFVAVAGELNFHRAAEGLRVSVPTLSVQIRVLEDLLGVELFRRAAAGVSLTVAGEVLLREARAFLQRVERLETATREAARGDGGCLRIGSPQHFSYSFMRQTLDVYHERFPRVELSLMELDLEHEHVAAVENGVVQVGFVHEPMLQLMRDVDHLLVFDTQMCAILAAAHPLAGLREVPVERLAEYPLLALGHYESHVPNMLKFFDRKKVRPKSIRRMKGFSAFAALLLSGGGVSILPNIRVFETFGPPLVMRPLKNPGVSARLRIHAVWKRSEASPQVLNFVQVLREGGVLSR